MFLPLGQRLAEGAAWCLVHSGPQRPRLSAQGRVGGRAVASGRTPEREAEVSDSGNTAVAGAQEGLRPEQPRAGDAAVSPERLARPGCLGLDGGQCRHQLLLSFRLSRCNLDTNGFQLLQRQQARRARGLGPGAPLQGGLLSRVPQPPRRGLQHEGRRRLRGWLRLRHLLQDPPQLLGAQRGHERSAAALACGSPAAATAILTAVLSLRLCVRHDGQRGDSNPICLFEL